MPGSHALLSASSSGRWIQCPPSVRLCEKYEDTRSEYALEGTEAHALCEFRLSRALGREAEDPVPGLTRYCPEMSDFADDYVARVLDEVGRLDCRDPMVLVEQPVDYSPWVRQGFGTADALVAADHTMTICDFKYGEGIRVDACGNTQMMCYALGGLHMFGDLYEISTIRLVVFQPRLSNVSVWEVPKEQLLEWGEKTLRPAAELAFAGEGDFNAGGWCRFCRAKHVCRARAEANILLAQRDFSLPPELEDAEIEALLPKLDEVIAWAGDVKEHALQQAIKGKEWHGFKLVEGRSNRRYADEGAVAKAVTRAGFEPYEMQLRGITAMQKLLGKKRFEELLSEFLVKPQGKPTLVPENDPRQQINTAKSDFAEE